MSTFGGDTSMINSWIAAGEDAPPPAEETIEQNGMIYSAGYGRWAKWEDFDRYVHTLFTDQCWKERNERSGFPIYIGHNGRMYYIDSAMGGGGHNKHISDLYRLEEKTDSAPTPSPCQRHIDPFWMERCAVHGMVTDKLRKRWKIFRDYRVKSP